MPLNWKEEEKTVEAADVEDFQTLYRDNLDLIYYYVLSKVANRQEAEDLTSQVFLKVVRGLDLKRDPRSLRTWSFRVARTTLGGFIIEGQRAPWTGYSKQGGKGRSTKRLLS
jgi:RNA polymerase sigma-70 factor (ECF subfamily)